MNKPRKVKIYYSLLPFAWLYGLVVRIRNWLFDRQWLTSRTFPLPVIAVGNLTVGGTGKTPHTEYLIGLLQNRFRVAVLSRGYKRKSKGFLLATPAVRMEEIGDEPFQMFTKFPSVTVAVDADRCHGIDSLMKCSFSAPQVVLLDDAYQHRYVKPGMTILLTDYNRLFTRDCMLPAGRLREPSEGKRRADVVIVSKCPENLSKVEQEQLRHELSLQPSQQLYFTTLKYGKLCPLFTAVPGLRLNELKKDSHILLLTGIASPALLIRDLKVYVSDIHPVTFPDHHAFTVADMQRIVSCFETLPANKMILTTEKDAARLVSHPLLPDSLKSYIYVLPVEICFLDGQQILFNQKIIEYVTENSRNSSLP